MLDRRGRLSLAIVPRAYFLVAGSFRLPVPSARYVENGATGPRGSAREREQFSRLEIERSKSTRRGRSRPVLAPLRYEMGVRHRL